MQKKTLNILKIGAFLLFSSSIFETTESKSKPIIIYRENYAKNIKEENINQTPPPYWMNPLPKIRLNSIQNLETINMYNYVNENSKDDILIQKIEMRNENFSFTDNANVDGQVSFLSHVNVVDRKAEFSLTYVGNLQNGSKKGMRITSYNQRTQQQYINTFDLEFETSNINNKPNIESASPRPKSYTIPSNTSILRHFIEFNYTTESTATISNNNGTQSYSIPRSRSILVELHFDNTANKSEGAFFNASGTLVINVQNNQQNFTYLSITPGFNNNRETRSWRYENDMNILTHNDQRTEYDPNQSFFQEISIPNNIQEFIRKHNVNVSVKLNNPNLGINENDIQLNQNTITVNMSKAYAGYWENALAIVSTSLQDQLLQVNLKNQLLVKKRNILRNGNKNIDIFLNVPNNETVEVKYYVEGSNQAIPRLYTVQNGYITINDNTANNGGVVYQEKPWTINYTYQENGVEKVLSNNNSIIVGSSNCGAQSSVFPNPSNRTANFSFVPYVGSCVKSEGVYNLLGQKVIDVDSEICYNKSFAYDVNIRDLPTGTYINRFRVECESTFGRTSIPLSVKFIVVK